MEKKPKDREQKYHEKFRRDLIDAGLKESENFEHYFTGGPDFVFLNYSILGEVKREETKSLYRDAFDELRKRKGNYKISNYDNFFVLTPRYISVYETEKIDWTKEKFDEKDFNNYTVRFDNNSENVELFCEYIKNECHKISVECDMSNVLDMLLEEKHHLTVQDAFYILFHLDDEYIYSPTSKRLVFNWGTENEYTIDDINKDDFSYIEKYIINKYQIKNENEVKEYIRHNYSKHLSDTKKSNLGKYYTPKKLVELIYNMVYSKIGENDYVMDLCCGCGAFMNAFKEFNLIGRDIDKNAIDVLKLLEYKNVEVDNSLFEVSREKYGFSDKDKICIIGNPPYNDVTSKNKRFGTNAKTITGTEIDADIKTNDLGRSFLKAYAKLKPEYICVLHPLAYLIKENNFKSLDAFKDNYKLIDGVIFSSSLFTDLVGNSEFPVVAALYEKGSMDYEHIRNFKFKIFESTQIFTLKKFTTIDDLPEANCIFGKDKKTKNRFKYPRKIDDHHILKSDIDLYQYNIRDTNSLMASGNIMALANNDNMNYCTIMFDELPYFAYIHNYRNFMKNDYLIGNLSPLVDVNDIHKEEFQDLMIITMILTDMHRIPMFNVDDESSIIYKRHIYNKCIRKHKKYDVSVNEYPDFYGIFLDFIEDKNEDNRQKYKDAIINIVSTYFSDLKKKFLNK